MRTKRQYKFGQKGFTLAELLIVVAIIAVLVAIAIPIFRTQLEKSREAHDIYTMRQAASAAVELYYAGVKDATTAAAAGLSWEGGGGNEGHNAYGAYEPGTGKILPNRPALGIDGKGYGKGTTVDAKTTYIMGNEKGAYKADQDYTNAVVMVSIYPDAAQPHVFIYWKNNLSSNKNYVGGAKTTNVPNYCIRINLN